MAALAFGIFAAFDLLPTILVADTWLLSPFPLFGILLVEVVRLLLVWQMWFSSAKR
jgi:hypothetical protein